MLRKFFAAVLIAGVGSQASADGYVGANYSRVRLEGAEPAAIDLRVGYQIDEALSVEARAGVPTNGDSTNLFGFDINFEASYLGGFGRYGAFRERGGVYGLVGFMELTIEVSNGDISEEDSKSDLVLGAGAEFGTEQGFVVEYLAGMRDLESISWINLGYFHKF
jgi:hypothetical protein